MAEPIECPKCHRHVIKIVSLTDDGKGKKMCIDCKRKYKKEHIDMNFSKVSTDTKGTNTESKIKG